MLIKRVETEKEVELMCRMKASSVGQNRTIKEMYLNHELILNRCFIMLYKGNVVARVIVLENDHFGLYTLEKMALDDAVSFVAYVLRECKCKQACMHLYSDKVHHQLVMDSLLYAGFQCSQEKESYIVIPKSCKSKLQYRNGNEVKKDVFLDMIKAVFYEHKDRGMRNDLKRMGLEKASEQLYDDSDADQLKFRIAAYIQNEYVGFVFLNELMSDVVGIGYIGVLPKYRGNHYSCELLKIASKVAYDNGYREIIADIDVENMAMRDNLLKVGFHKSCDEKVFLYQK